MGCYLWTPITGQPIDVLCKHTGGPTTCLPIVSTFREIFGKYLLKLKSLSNMQQMLITYIPED